MSKKRIFIDPGHGGHDPGAIGANSKEAENVLAVAIALEKKLKAQGYEVKLSRRTNVYVTLNDRAKIANEWGADIFISFHDNSAVNKTATGFETYIFNGSVSTNTIKLQKAIHEYIVRGIGLRDRGMKRANFAVIRLTKMPAVLIEYGFISNLNDERIIAFEIEKQARLTYEGINNYFGVKISDPTPKKDNQTHFINTVKDHVASCWSQHRILPSVVMAQAILESGWGTSDKAIKANNLFGIKAASDWKGQTVTLPTKEYVSGKWITVDAKWRKYNSWGHSIVDHAQFLKERPRYKAIIGNTDYKFVCQELQKAGYATDPAYASKLISIIEANNLSQFDNFDKEEEKVYSSGTLKAEHDITRESAARRKIIVEAAIKAGYNEIWREKLEDGTITADDVDALATGTIVKNHK
ncbi:N-acetylmuramoyl-L-alanine amidase [Solibacillus sp. A46]|uniref:N-acetylmuramoyl-L-alanine amidase n=1 Tax=Solibacillus faecavium TaxID=2762221 RepID=A0ABR8XYN6_9BACL|nr:N-acetylmuramoyl-L-alanine amidase [Solibacillus faecavium]MBD8037067.1 N-acetylmuramoyl-L-alanine amidase [Solibacillus faecavium]